MSNDTLGSYSSGMYASSTCGDWSGHYTSEALPSDEDNNEDRPASQWKIEKRKQIILKHVQKIYKEYLKERGWKNVETGVKWFLYFLGLAVLFNFGKILNILAALAGVQ